MTGHQLIERECGRGRRTKASAPQGAEAPVQYGPRIAAIIDNRRSLSPGQCGT